MSNEARRRWIALKVLQQDWMERQETRLDSETGERIWGLPLRCDGCSHEVSELIHVGDVALCGDCSTFVMEAKHYRHSGRLCTLPDPRGNGSSPERTRLSDPVKPKEAMKVYRRDGFTCRYCGESGGDLTVDHIDPEGGNEMGNYATACRSCNSSKGRRTPEEADMELAAAD